MFISLLGHGLVLQEEFAAPSDHLGRRLMAIAGDNETEEKNCTEPGNAVEVMPFLSMGFITVGATYFQFTQTLCSVAHCQMFLQNT